MENNGKIPVIVGVTGHRDLRAQDIEVLREAVHHWLGEMQAKCPHSQIAVMSSLAAGADQLCAETALDMGLEIMTVLPMPEAEYAKDFTEEELEKLHYLTSRSSSVIVAPHSEIFTEGRDYLYRQAGIYVAEHCHVLLALWDGSEGIAGGCGTSSIVEFKRGNLSRAAGEQLRHFEGHVVQIVTPRQEAGFTEGDEVSDGAREEVAAGTVILHGDAASLSSDSDEGRRRRAKLRALLVSSLNTGGLSKEFGEAFWHFVKDGGYRNKSKTTGESQFYRFSAPANQGFPKMIELFARTDWMENEQTVLTPIHIDDSVSSLSAILLNEAYYRALLEGKTIVNGLSVLRPSWLILFKAKAWLDLKDGIDMGEPVDSNDIKKHRNDIIRIASEMILDECKVEGEIREDIVRFLNEADITNELIHDLKIYGVRAEDITDRLRTIYL